MDNEERFVIDNDNKADWALRQIRDEYAERDRLIEIAKMQIEELKARIEELNEQYENKVSFLRGSLCEYFQTVPHKETKTQSSYKLLSGSLVLKKESEKITHENDDALVSWLKESGHEDLIKVTVAPNWVEVKKLLDVVDGKVIDTTSGEVVDACDIESVAPHFDVKL